MQTRKIPSSTAGSIQQLFLRWDLSHSGKLHALEITFTWTGFFVSFSYNFQTCILAEDRLKIICIFGFEFKTKNNNFWYSQNYSPDLSVLTSFTGLWKWKSIGNGKSGSFTNLNLKFMNFKNSVFCLLTLPCDQCCKTIM